MCSSHPHRSLPPALIDASAPQPSSCPYCGCVHPGLHYGSCPTLDREQVEVEQ